jgi:osmotically-inducible protein OsmY
MFLKQKDSVPVWQRIAFTILLVTSVGITGCTSSSRVNPSEAAPGDALIDDNVINLAVNKRLIDDGLGLFKDVKAVVYRQRVLLIGKVEQIEHRERAGALVAEVENVVQVMNEIQVNVENGIGAFITDVIIEKLIQSDYLFDDIVDSDNYRVRSVNGTVYIIGHAANRAEFDRALALANATDDVKHVVNYIALDPM